MKIDKKTFPANSGPMLIVDAKTGGDLFARTT